MPPIAPLTATVWLSQAASAAWGLAYLLVVYGCSWLCAKVGVAIALRPFLDYRGDSWVERARLLYPAVLANRRSMLLLPALFIAPILVVSRTWQEPGTQAFMILTALAAYLGVTRVGRSLYAHARGRAVTRLEWRRTVAFLWLVMRPVMLVLAVLAIALPFQLDAWALAILALGGVAVGWLMVGGAYWIARAAGLTEPAPARLAAAVDVAANRVGIRPRETVVLRVPFANAFAFFLPRKIGVTTGALEALSDDELAAVIAHELGHLTEPKSVAALRVAGPLLLVMLVALKPLVGSFGWVPSIAAVVAVFILLVVLLNVTKRMEKRADRIASSHEGDAGTYARALERIYQFNMIPVVMHKRFKGAHPDLYDRLIASGVTPAYPRPQPPSRTWSELAGVASFSIAFASLIALTVMLSMSTPRKNGATFINSMELRNSDDEALNLDDSAREAIPQLEAPPD